MSDIATNLHVTDAGKGWRRIWRGNDLIAACPSQGQADEVVRAFDAQEELEIARQKIALLERTLDQQLCGRVFLGLRVARGK